MRTAKASRCLIPKVISSGGETRAIIDDCIYLDLDTPVPLDFMDHTPQETNDLINNLVYVVTKGDLRLFEPPGRSSLFSSRTDQDV